MNKLTTDTVFKLKNGIEIFPFDSKLSSNDYLISVENCNYRVSEIIYKITNLIDGSRSLNDILVKINTDGNNLSEESLIKIFSTYLIPNGIVLGNCEITKRKTNHLYFKYLILSKDKLHPITNILKHIFSKSYVIPIIICLCIFYLYLFIFENITSVSLSELKGSEVVLMYFVIYATIFFHELGHLSACHYYNIEYKEIGVGLYLYFLVFYSDVSKTWKLNRKQRIVVDLGGIYFQLISIFFLYILSIIFNNVAFIYAIYLTILSILFSLNPFFKFDGYWIVSDLMGISNLRKHVYNYLKMSINNLFKRNIVLCDSDSKNLPKKIKYNFIFYIVLSNLFFAINIIYLFTYFSFHFNDLYEKFFIGIKDLSNNFIDTNLVDVVNKFNNLFPYLVLFFSFSVIAIINIKKIIDFLIKYNDRTKS